MNLIVDIGNTMVKLAVMDGGQVIVQRSSEHLSPQLLDELLAQYKASKAIVSSTRGSVAKEVAMVREKVGYTIVFESDTPVPIANHYASPQTLGRDRLAAAVGAVELYQGRNVLIVDFGTALTIDLVSADGAFQGGFISPGVQSRFRALHEFTASLPLLTPTDEQLMLGRTTREAIEQGVMQGVEGEIEGHISRMSERYGEMSIIFTGGDAKYFVKRIKKTIFANCNLVLCGLERILEYNASEENPD